jgi:hypothetical protein
MTEAQVRKLLRSAIDKAGGLRAFCQENDLDPGQVSRINNGAKLSPAILAAIGVEAIGVVTTYRRTRK